MPDPYEILGLPPTAGPDDAETAFRRLLKEAHPDRHVGASDRELALAERRTRELTEAIRAVRHGWRPPRRPWEDDHGFHATPETDWFGFPTAPPKGTIECPFCHVSLETLADYDLHLVAVHGIGVVGRGTPSRHRRVLHWLRFLPAPSLTLLLALVLWWVVVIRLTPPEVERVGIWCGVLGFLVLRGLVHHAQRRRL